MRVRIIANPVSGRGRAGRLAPHLADALRRQGASVDVVFTTRRGDATGAAREGGGEADVLVAVGGDGTVNEVLNGMSLPGPVLAALPTGTANVLAKTLGLPREPSALARAIAAGATAAWDVGVREETGQRFLLMAGAGFDAAVVHDFHARRRGTIHMMEYLAWGLRYAAAYRSPRLRVEIDGCEEPDPAAFVLASNAPEYGGPLRLTAGARPEDGRFEVLLLRSDRRRDLFRLFAHAHAASLARAAFVPPPGAVLRSARRIRIASSGPVPLQLDGDPAGFLPATLTLRPAAVRLVLPGCG